MKAGFKILSAKTATTAELKRQKQCVRVCFNVFVFYKKTFLQLRATVQFPVAKYPIPKALTLKSNC